MKNVETTKRAHMNVCVWGMRVRGLTTKGSDVGVIVADNASLSLKFTLTHTLPHTT